MHVKSAKIVTFQGDQHKKPWFSLGAMSLLTLFAGLIAIHGAMTCISPGIDFQEEFIAFWSYKELGIQQGYIFVPLVAFAGYQQYKMTFLMRAKYRTVDTKSIWKDHLRAIILLLCSAALALGVCLFLVLPEVVYVLSIVAGCSAYSWFFKNELR